MKRLFLAITLILWASTSWAMSPSFWAAVTAGGGGATCSGGLVLNGCFESGTTSWSATNVNFSVTSGVATITNSTTAYGQIYQGGRVSGSTLYNYTIIVDEIINGGVIRLKVGNTVAGGSSITAAGTYSGTVTTGAGGVDVVVAMNTNVAGQGGKVSKVYVALP